MKWLPLLLLSFSLIGQETDKDNSPALQLFHDLETVNKVDQQIRDHLPLMINYQLQGGYFTTPSARTFDAGTFGFSFAYLPPHHIWSLGFQFFDCIETTGTYQVINNNAERSVNIKGILFHKDTAPSYMPALAVGLNNVTASHRSRSTYIVATREFLSLHLETTLGWSTGHIHGIYGGLAWTPFRHSNLLLKPLTLATEVVNNHINTGLQYTIRDFLRFSCSTLRGRTFATSAAITYNLGNSKGFLPKIKDPPPYCGPIDTQPMDHLRNYQELAQKLASAFQEQGLDLHKLYLIPDTCGTDRLWIKIVNVRYREETEVRSRIEHVLAALTPADITAVTAVTEADGIPIQEYQFRTQDLKRYAARTLGEDEFRTIAPAKEASSPPKQYDSTLLYRQRKAVGVFTVRPWFRSFLGSSRAKFKYELGLSVNPEGYLFDEIYYNLCGTYTAKSSRLNLNNSDVPNPSYLLTVRTDSILYNQSNSLHLDQAYIQKSWNVGCGWFSRVAAGYFETAYAGIALETLYFPVGSHWAIGLSTASLLKRSYYGIDFQRKIRHLTHQGLTYVPFIGWQYFIDFYYQYKPLSLDFKISAGGFLARDKGVRIEGGRTFQNGLRIGLWYTPTNARDIVNGRVYNDKGFSINMPFDMFLFKSSRTRLNYAMSVRLRDCGAISATGKQLYPTLFWARQNTKLKM